VRSGTKSSLAWTTGTKDKRFASGNGCADACGREGGRRAGRAAAGASEAPARRTQVSERLSELHMSWSNSLKMPQRVGFVMQPGVCMSRTA